jgi:hypothetical protein
MVATPSSPDAPLPAPSDGTPAAQPNSFDGASSRSAPSVVVAQYDPRTGEYSTPDGETYRQSDLAVTGSPRNWKDMLLK